MFIYVVLATLLSSYNLVCLVYMECSQLKREINTCIDYNVKDIIIELGYSTELQLFNKIL